MANTFTNLIYHIVFSTKGRLPLIRPEWRERLWAYMGGILRGEKGVPLEIGGTSDHAHVMSKLPPAKALAMILDRLKSHSSKWINENRLLPAAFQWQRGYSAFTVSESAVPRVREYIRSQEKHHQRRTFEDELRELLQKNNIDYDEKFLLG